MRRNGPLPIHVPLEGHSVMLSCTCVSFRAPRPGHTDVYQPVPAQTQGFQLNVGYLCAPLPMPVESEYLRGVVALNPESPSDPLLNACRDIRQRGHTRRCEASNATQGRPAQHVVRTCWKGWRGAPTRPTSSLISPGRQGDGPFILSPVQPNDLSPTAVSLNSPCVICHHHCA